MAVTIQYGTYTFPNVFSPYKYTQTATDASLEFNSLLTGSSSGNLITLEENMLAAVRLVKQAFKVSFNGSSEFDVSHIKKGFVSKVTAVKMESPELSTETSRPYRIIVNFQLPYTQDSYKIAANWVLNKSASKQSTFTFSAQYSASESSPPVTATANAIADFFTWAESIIVAFKDSGEIYERILDNISTDINDRRATATATYQQVLYEYNTIPTKIYQGRTIYSLQIQPNINTGLFKYTSAPVGTLSVSFAGFIVKTEIKTQPIKDFKAYIKQQLITDSTSILDFSSLGFAPPYQLFIQKSNISFDPSTYQISGSMSFIFYLSNSTSSDIISYTESVNVSYNSGWVRQKLWDGKPNTYHNFSSGSTCFLTRTVQCVSKELFLETSIPAIPRTYFSPFSEGRWLPDSYTGTAYLEKIGATSDTSDTTPNQAFYHTSYTLKYTFVDTDNSVFTIITI